MWLTLFGPTFHGEGADEVAANLRRVGADGLILFTSLYHGYRLIQRRYPQQAIYSLETDRVFFEPDMARYADCLLQPERSLDFPGRDVVAELSVACRGADLKFAPLRPACAGERIVQEHPEVAVTNIYGSHDRLFMCYNNPKARKYRIAILADILNVEPGAAPDPALSRHIASMLDVWCERTLATLDGGCPQPNALTVAALRLGHVVFAFAGAELFAETGRRVQERVGDAAFVLPTGYTGPMVGYLPDAAAMRQGGYEVDYAWRFYGQAAPFAEETEEVVVERLTELVRAVCADQCGRGCDDGKALHDAQS